jgi:hypothetical protein
LGEDDFHLGRLAPLHRLAHGRLTSVRNLLLLSHCALRRAAARARRLRYRVRHFPFRPADPLHHRWIPGAWCSAENLDCAAYFAYFGPYLLNQRYAIMPGVEAIRQRDWLFSVFGRDDKVFARPTSCHKLFVGRCLDRESFAAGLAPTRYDPSTLVVIAAPQPIAREWRLVVVDDRVVSGSQYAIGGERAIAAGCPSEVQAFAAAMLAEVRWRPDPAFMLDLCESAGKLWLVELNSFSGSWLYGCELPAVVAGASELAERSWQQRHAEPADAS